MSMLAAKQLGQTVCKNAHKKHQARLNLGVLSESCALKPLNSQLPWDNCSFRALTFWNHNTRLLVITGVSKKHKAKRTQNRK